MPLLLDREIRRWVPEPAESLNPHGVHAGFCPRTVRDSVAARAADQAA
jgi:hypothetical protein